MLVALDEFGNRISPFTGGRAVCQYCGNTLEGCAGEIVIPYWRHQKGIACDTWKGGETKWHRSWKMKYPMDFREVLVFNEEGERHIADIKNSKDLVIEFQNSPIDVKTIRIREDFYNNMLWVVNAQEFEKNFRLSDAVKHKREDIKKSYELELKEKCQYDECVLEDTKYRCADLKTKLSWKRREMECSMALIEAMDLTDEVERLSQLERLHRHKYDVEIYSRIPEFKREISEFRYGVQNLLRDLRKLKSYEVRAFGENSFFIVPYDIIVKQKCEEVYVIEKSLINGLFPPIKIEDETEFETFSHNKNAYYWLVEQKWEEYYVDKTVRMKSDFGELLESVLVKHRIDFKNRIKDLENEIYEKNKKIDFLDKKLCETKSRLERVYLANKKMIKSKYKNKYHLEWKNERKTWFYSNKVVFFDTGKGYLLKRVEKEIVEKVRIENFVKETNV